MTKNDDLDNPLLEPVEVQEGPTLCKVLMKRANMLLMLFFFLVTGVMQPTLIDTLKHNGAVHKHSFLTLVPNYLAMCCLIFLPTELGFFQLGFKRLAIGCTVGFVDVLSQALYHYGLILCGGGTGNVVYSSVTVFTAVLSVFIIRKRLAFFQWVGVFLVTGGLGMTGVGAKSDGSDVLTGVLLVLAGSFLHALTYVLDEKIMKADESNVIPPTKLGGIFGFSGLLVLIIYIGAVVVPRWDHYVTDGIKEKNGVTWIIISSFFGLFMSNLVHSLCFFLFIGSVGSVTTGILKGAQAVLVFVWGVIVFCPTEKAQCGTWFKAGAMLIVVSGVFLYSVSAPRKAKEPEPPAGHEPLLEKGDDDKYP